MSAAPCEKCRRATNHTPCPVCDVAACEGCRAKADVPGRRPRGCCIGTEWDWAPQHDGGEPVTMQIIRITPARVVVSDGLGYEDHVRFADFKREWTRHVDEEDAA